MSCLPTTYITIYIIIAKNIRYLLWNRGAWRFFHDTYLTIEVKGIRCTHHLHDSCPLTDINPHFTAPPVPILFQNLTADCLLWRHRHVGQPLANVTSQWSIVPMGIYGRMMLSSTRVKGILGLTSLFTFLFIFGPRVSTRGIATVKPVYNDHQLGYFSACWSSAT